MIVFGDHTTLLLLKPSTLRISGIMLFGTLTYTLGCSPLDIRPYHRTSETIFLNNTFLSLNHIGTHLMPY